MSFECVTKSDGRHKGVGNSENYFQKYILDEERRLKTNETRQQKVPNPNHSSIPLDVDICNELREYKNQDILEQKRRQKLRCESHELRLLQNQLQVAFVSRELAEQRAEQEKRKQLEIQRKREEDDNWLAECEKSKRIILQQEEKERQKKNKVREILQEQMREMQQKRKNEFESVIKDREDMEKTLKHIQAEEKAEKDLSQRFRDLCRKEMEECVRSREIQRQLEKEQNLDDTEKLMAYQMERDEMKSRMEAQKRQIIAEKMALSERIGNELAAVKSEKEKREELLISLLIEERKAKEDLKYRQNIERKIREQGAIKSQLEAYRKEIAAQKQLKLQEEEKRIREEFMRQMAEQDKLDQLSDEKRRRKVMEHNKALREMIELRRSQRAEEIAERISEYGRLLKTEQRRNQCIEDERIRILQSTPKELLRYLPPGVIKPSDREFLSLQPE
ncbi:trichohyalin [Stomoxys calcitrans]|uniref:Meiosis-specific nuclear structural protein 1 n=1 Tax=Stomoxys calcitrans TaxID=35570 RepID=A0A1I8NVE9_STOCA|nr:trichohyalin [Stomoxys calcitrans]